jgi:putative radical SAM enzyme (TIGR03279 family)
MSINEMVPGIKIESIGEGSIASEIGLETGDRLVALNGNELEDGLDYRFRVSNSGEFVTLRVQKADGELWDVEIEIGEEEDLGIELEDIQTRICKNNCIFCFVHQLPRGKHIRRTLRVKDEDFRLSFLHGNYLTLTNLSDSNFQRIIDQHLSPLYISVHATEPELRQYLLQSRHPDQLMKHLGRLVNGVITLHAQIVLMPGVNDGVHLERSIFDLLQFYPGLQTVAIVPVGLTDHRQGLKSLTPVDPIYARKTIRVVQEYQKKIQNSHGTPFCFLGDEFYILADQPLPGRRHYGEFPILENGVGMVRRFQDEFRTALRRKWHKPATQVRGTVVTGKIFHPILEKCVAAINQKIGTQLKCRMAPNLFLGKAITVAGLLAGGDIYSAVKDEAIGDFLIVPSEAMIGDDGLFLDDWHKRNLEDRLGVPIHGGGYHAGDFLQNILSGKVREYDARH